MINMNLYLKNKNIFYINVTFDTGIFKKHWNLVKNDKAVII